MCGAALEQGAYAPEKLRSRSPAWTIKSRPSTRAQELEEASHPGPGQYSPVLRQSSPAHTMGTRTSGIAKDLTPGPVVHVPFLLFLLFSVSSHSAMQGAYGTPTRRSGSPAYTMGTRLSQHSEDPDRPGPVCASCPPFFFPLFQKRTKSFMNPHRGPTTRLLLA